MKTPNRIVHLWAFILLFVSAMVQAQPICQIQHFSIYNGLPQRTVTDIAQDGHGFMWLATWNGLSKYDGYTFKNYKAYPGDGCTLTSNRLYSIKPNQNNDIWCQTYDNRIYLFDSQEEKFIDILHPIEIEERTTFTVKQIYTLPKGITWIACSQGSFRIDEKAFKAGDKESIRIYSSEKGNLVGTTLTDVFQDAEGDEWIFTDKGAQVIGKKSLPEKNRFTRATENNGSIYLISDSTRLAIYDLKSRQLRHTDFPSGFSMPTNIQNIGKDSLGICTTNGILSYYAQEKRFQWADLRTTQPTIAARFFFKDSHGELWVYTTGPGILRYNLRTGEKQHYQTDPKDIAKTEQTSKNTIFEDSQGTLWVVPTAGNLSYYDRKDKKLKPYYTDYNDPKSKFTPVIRNHLIDKQKNFWFTNNYEMNKLSFFPSACQVESLDQGYDTRAFLTDSQQRLWIATKKGIIRIYNDNGSLKGYLSPSGAITSEEVSFGKSIYCFLEDDRGNIWMGSKWDGLFKLESTGKERFKIQNFTHQEGVAHSLSNNSVYAICQDSRKRIWVCTYGNGLNLLEETPEGETRFLHRSNRLTQYPQNKHLKVRTIKEVNHTLLVGTTDGLLTFSTDFKEPEEIRFYQNVRVPQDASSLCSNDVMYIYTDHRKHTYVLTFTGGINQIMSDSLLSDHIRFKSHTKQNGLYSDLLLGMIEDRQHNLWVVSENTLSRFDPEHGTFDYYDEKYLQKEIYFSEAAPIAWHNQLIIGTESGIARVFPDLFKKSSYVPPIVFTGLRIQGVPQKLPINELKELELKPTERNVTFQYAALDYADTRSIKYAYRLKGLEEAWNEVDNNRTASYINLPPGKYKLQIRSTNGDGIWADNLRTLSVNVLPTFWETPWAWILYALLFILSTATIVYIILYIYRLRHRINLEHQLSNIKLRFFTDISHELRTPLTLITSPVSEVLEHESLSPAARKHLTLVHKNTERMLRLVNQILDFRKIENKKMKVLLEQTDITTLLQRVMDNFRLIAEEKHIDFRLIANPEEIRGWIDRDKFEKIVFNLVSNAFKYTPAHKSITLSARSEGGNLSVAVRDEGIGIDPKRQQALFQRFETLVRHNILQPSSGIGLSLVKELIELHQGSIRVNSRQGEGSEFIVTLPLEASTYKGKENTEFIMEDVASEAGKESSTSTPPAPMETQTEKQATGSPAEHNPETEADETQTVLIVEDNTELRGFLRDILAESYRVIEAVNGQEGLEMAQQHLPDFLISDIMMPVMDGLDMVKAIKENRDICHIPIILLSAKSSLDDRITGLEQGIDDYITKPFSSTYLKTRIKTLLQQRRRLQELYLRQWTERQPIPPAHEEESVPATSSTVPVQTSIAPPQPHIVPFDEQFMQHVMEVMEKEMDNSELTIDEFARQLNMGRTVFYQKLKSVVGLSPVDFIRDMRIKRAKQLIDSGGYNVSTIAYMTGFNDPKYFSKCFKKQFGISPSEYSKGKKTPETAE